MIKITTYDIKYSCGCIHEIEEKNNEGIHTHRPTGNNRPCGDHAIVSGN